MSIITIVGAGMMGSAMSFPVRENGHEVRLVGTPLDREIICGLLSTGWHPTLKRKLPDGVRFYQIERVGEALEGADALVCGVSSFGVDWFGGDVVPSYSGRLARIVCDEGHAERAGRYARAVPSALRAAISREIIQRRGRAVYELRAGRPRPHGSLFLRG